MEQVVILKNDGRPVKINDDFSNLVFDIDGYINEFTHINKRYRYYHYDDFKTKDLILNGLRGYFEETSYLQYIQYVGGNAPTAEELKKVDKFNFDNFLASAGDPINVEFVDFSSPYNYYYKNKNCSFTIELDPLTNKVKNYRDVITSKISIPVNAVITQLNKDLNATPRGYFYNKNFGDSVNTWFVDDYGKELYCRAMTLIAFRIYDITTKIFPNIISAESLVKVEQTANSTNPEIDNLTDLEKLVFTIKKSWGDFYIPGSTLPHRQNFDAVLSNTSNYDEYIDYLNSLDNFYVNVYKRQNIIAAKPPQQQLEILLEILPSSGLSLIPIDLRLKMLVNLMKESLDEVGEALVLRILYSVNENEKTPVLDFLLKTEDGVHTNFEVLYNTMDDERLKRYPFVSWFADEEPNRMYFVAVVHSLWKNSKYDFEKIDGEFNNECYFLHDGMFYSRHPDGRPKDTFLEFGQTYIDTFIEATDLLRIEKTFTNYKCKKELSKELVTIEKFVDYSNSYTNKSGRHLGSAPSLDSQQKTETTYHLYQALSLCGHKQSETMVVPNSRPIPAFLFYYTDDFERLKKIDTAFSAGIEIGIEIALFFTFAGGASALRHLRHIKHITKIHKALQGSLAAEETVLVWRGLETTSETISVSASIMMSLNTYNISELPDGPEKERRKKLNTIFLYITLAFAGVAAVSRTKAVKAADELLDEIAGLPPGSSLMPDDIVLDVLTPLKGETTLALALFEGQMTSYPNIISKFGSYSPELKKAFWSDFRLKIQDNTFWTEINKSVDNMDNWRDLHLLGIEDRKILEFVTNSERVTAIKRFYNEIELRKALEPLDYEVRIKFLDDFKNVESTFLNRLNDNPKTISNWTNLNGEQKLFAKENPLLWLENEIVNVRFEKLYVRPGFLPPKIPSSQVLENYGQNALILFNSVEDEVFIVRSSFSRNKQGEKALVSGMTDTSTGEISALFTNFTKREIDGGIYDDFIQNLHPNMRVRFDQSVLKRELGMYTLNNKNDLVYTGDNIAAHAEIRALNDLTVKKFGMTEIDTSVFDKWLESSVIGYNSHLRKDGIMHTCADCFYLTDLVTYIK